MKITKTTTRTYEIYACAKWEMSVGDTILKREKIGIKSKGLDKCFVCGRKFRLEEMPYLALIRNHTNMFVCEKCAWKIKENEHEQEEQTKSAKML